MIVSLLSGLWLAMLVGAGIGLALAVLEVALETE